MKQNVAKIAATVAAGTAFFGSCCALPLLLLSLGVGNAWLATAVARFRPHLIGITVVLLGVSFYTVYCRKPCCEEGSCDVQSIHRTKIWLWIATGIALLFLIGPALFARFILS